MDSVQRRRESQFSIPMEEQLTRAVELRIEAEEEFKRQIVFSLKDLIQKLAECDPSNARTTLDLTQQQLAIIIAKLNDTRKISSTEAQTIANVVKENNLFRGPILPQAPSALPPASFTQSPPPSSLPTPASFTKPAQRPNTSLTSIVNPGVNTTSLQNTGLKAGRVPGGGRRTRRRRKTRR
jgi:hypothetical protein